MFINRDSQGFKVLRTWQQAGEILKLTDKLAETFPLKNPKTGQYLTDLKDQMIRSARSVIRNIEEGYSRNSTGEYVNFLGFSFGSLEELIGDYEYCLENSLGDAAMAGNGLKFCRGEAKMLKNQMESLKNKMIKEKTFSAKDTAKMIIDRQNKERKDFDNWLEQIERDLKGDKGE